eukprot:tig00000269_g23772.t1
MQRTMFALAASPASAGQSIAPIPFTAARAEAVCNAARIGRSRQAQPALPQARVFAVGRNWDYIARRSSHRQPDSIIARPPQPILNETPAPSTSGAAQEQSESSEDIAIHSEPVAVDGAARAASSDHATLEAGTGGGAGDGNGAGGNGGNGGSGGRGGGGGGDDDAEERTLSAAFSASDLEAMLDVAVEKGHVVRTSGGSVAAVLDSFPAELRQPASSGALSPQMIAQYVRMACNPALALLMKIGGPGLRSRILADHEFLYKLGIEQAIGFCSVSAAEAATRGKRLWKELEFVLCDLMITAAANFVAVWLVAPVLSLNHRSRPGSSAFTAYLDALPSHCFEQAAAGSGPYTAAQRLATVFVRGGQYGVIGTAAGFIGTGATHALVALRRAVAPRSLEESSANELPPLVQNSVTLGGFMAVSSNPRYQLVNGLEQGIERALGGNEAANKGAIALLRFANSVWGDAQWVWLSYALGLQQKHGAEEEEAEAEAAPAGPADAAPAPAK